MLTRLHTRRFPDTGICTPEQARELALIAFSCKRHLGLLIDRKGGVDMVIVGDQQSVCIPELERAREGRGRLSGLRFLHILPTDGLLTQEDIMDMIFLRLDAVIALGTAGGAPTRTQSASLLPGKEKGWQITDPVRWDVCQIDFRAQAQAIEDELARTGQILETENSQGCALLVSVSTQSHRAQLLEMEELAELARTAGLIPAGQFIQRVSSPNSNHILGKGKLAELEISALQHGAGLLLFNQELTPAQQRNLSRITERQILDRTQLILDIFAQRALTKAGKIQVEIAQLKYMLPRLVGQNRALSRLAGGIGGRGPGETRLEMDRRKTRNRLGQLQRELQTVRRHRETTRRRRKQAGLPVIALVGYTNAGKSTLLNTLTDSHILAEDKLFATLDPTSRRLRFPQDQEVILTDTVGFIRELPQDLKQAFLATLEELGEASVLIQVADASHPQLEEQIAAVNGLLRSLGLEHIPRGLALNKWDIVAPDLRDELKQRFPEGSPVSARQKNSLHGLIEHVQKKLLTQHWSVEPSPVVQ